jgi:hypothetical protein
MLKVRFPHKWSVLAVGIALLAASASPSRAVTFDFSFSNTIGDTNGTVSGYIVLPSANGTNEVASSVVVTGVTGDAYTNIILNAPTTLPYNPLAAPASTPTNSFNVTAGLITSYSFSAFDAFSGGNLLLYFVQGGTDELILEGGSAGEHTDQSEAITFTPVTTTPLPPTWATILAGLVGLAFILHRRQKPLSGSAA